MRHCTACRHPEVLQIDEMLVRKVPLRKISEETGLSIPSLHRHRQHLAGTLVKADNAKEVADASTLLTRVEDLITELRDLGKEARKHKSYAAAASALAQVRGCLELLGKLSGELTAAASLQFHKHLHIESQNTVPRSEQQLDREIAELVRQSTNDFDLGEFHRLRLLLQPCAVLEGASDLQPKVPVEAVSSQVVMSDVREMSVTE